MVFLWSLKQQMQNTQRRLWINASKPAASELGYSAVCWWAVKLDVFVCMIIYEKEFLKTKTQWTIILFNLSLITPALSDFT